MIFDAFFTTCLRFLTHFYGFLGCFMIFPIKALARVLFVLAPLLRRGFGGPYPGVSEVGGIILTFSLRFYSGFQRSAELWIDKNKVVMI